MTEFGAKMLEMDSFNNIECIISIEHVCMKVSITVKKKLTGKPKKNSLSPFGKLLCKFVSIFPQFSAIFRNFPQFPAIFLVGLRCQFPPPWGICAGWPPKI